MWLEADLEAHGSDQIVLFLHVPPFLVDEEEPGLGSYDVLSDPDRAWLLGLVRRHGVEAIFCGHTHFRFFNRLGATRIHVAPSTTTTRPGFYEAISVSPPDRGWGDTDKLGFFLVRGTEEGLAVHVIRSSGHTSLPEDGRQTVLTATTQELPRSPLGAYLRLPLANESDGAIVYPYHVRHRVRDVHPLLACIELGLRHVRVPIGDLDSPLQRERLLVLQDEGVSITATVISDGSELVAFERMDGADTIEVQIARIRRAPTDGGGGDQTTGRQAEGQPGADRHGVHGHRSQPQSDRLPSPRYQGARRGTGTPGHPHRSRGCLVDAASGSPWEAVLALGTDPMRLIPRT